MANPTSELFIGISWVTKLSNIHSRPNAFIRPNAIQCHSLHSTQYELNSIRLNSIRTQQHSFGIPDHILGSQITFCDASWHLKSNPEIEITFCDANACIAKSRISIGSIDLLRHVSCVATTSWASRLLSESQTTSTSRLSAPTPPLDSNKKSVIIIGTQNESNTKNPSSRNHFLWMSAARPCENLLSWRGRGRGGGFGFWPRPPIPSLSTARFRVFGDNIFVFYIFKTRISKILQ